MAKKTTASGLRKYRGNLQTAVQHYEHPDGRWILMVGIVHTAEPDYYKRLRYVVEAAEEAGARVHYEKIRGLDDDDVSGVARNDVELAALRSMREGRDIRFVQLPSLFGLDWVYQHDGAMAPASSWINADVLAIDFVRMLGPQTVINMEKAIQRQKRAVDAVASSSPRLLRMHRRLFVDGYVRQKAPRKYVQAMCTWREYQAAVAALAEPGNLVLVWHGLHIAPIAEILVRNDFTLTGETQWITAVHKPKRRHR